MCITIYDLEDEKVMTVDEMTSQLSIQDLEQKWKEHVNPAEREEHNSWKNPIPPSIFFQLDTFQT